MLTCVPERIVDRLDRPAGWAPGRCPVNDGLLLLLDFLLVRLEQVQQQAERVGAEAGFLPQSGFNDSSPRV